VNLITPNQNHEQKLTKIFKLKQVKFLTKTQELLEHLLPHLLEQLLPLLIELLLPPLLEHLLLELLLLIKHQLMLV
jgi:hypothetical protein